MTAGRKGDKAIAFMSIAFVILIFAFVFRETLPIFRANQQHESLADQSREKLRAGARGI